METPVTKKFFKKLELYLELKRQNRRSQKSIEGKKMWSMEKALLRWAVVGHWHRGTPLFPDFLQGRLREQKFPEEWVKDVRKVAQNLISRDFAYHPPGIEDTDVIQITEDGFLFGELIEELETPILLKIPNPNQLLYKLVVLFFWFSLLAAGVTIIKPVAIDLYMLVIRILGKV